MTTIADLVILLEGYNQHLPLNTLLCEDMFATLLHDAYTTLPMESRSTFRKAFEPEHTEHPRVKRKRVTNTALSQVQMIKEFPLPPDAHQNFQNWKQDPSRFWQIETRQRWRFETSIDGAATQVYLALQQLQGQQKWYTIRYRFYTSFLFQLFELAGNGQTTMSKGRDQKLLQIISQSKMITDSTRIIRSKLRSWIAIGRGYCRLCQHLGFGALFLLPVLPDKIWEKEDASFEIAISHLKSQGILELSYQLGVDSLGYQILEAALEPLRWNHSTISTEAQSGNFQSENLSCRQGMHSINALLNEEDLTDVGRQRQLPWIDDVERSRHPTSTEHLSIEDPPMSQGLPHNLVPNDHALTSEHDIEDLSRDQTTTRNISTYRILEVLRRNPDSIFGSIWLVIGRNGYKSNISLRVPCDLVNACFSNDEEAQRSPIRLMTRPLDGVYSIACGVFIDSLRFLEYGTAFCNRHPYGEANVFFITIWVQGEQLLNYLIQAGEFLLIPE